MRDSSVFGLVELLRRRPLAATGFDFRVASLQVRFANSHARGLPQPHPRRAERAVRQAPVQQDQAPDNVLEIDGSYQRHGASGTYVFTESRPTTLPAVRVHPALRGVRVVQAQFATAAPPPASGGAAGTGEVYVGVLVLGCALLRARSPRARARRPDAAPFDVFSFDSLVFADLRLAMTFPPGRPARAPSRSTSRTRRSTAAPASPAPQPRGALPGHPAQPRRRHRDDDPGGPRICHRRDGPRHQRRSGAVVRPRLRPQPGAASARSPPGPGSSSASASSGRRTGPACPCRSGCGCPARPARRTSSPSRACSRSACSRSSSATPRAPSCWRSTASR